MATPVSLAKVFVVITYMWHVTRLANLRQVLANMQSYPTDITLCVVTDSPTNLKNVLSTWNMTVAVEGPLQPLKHHHYLTWEHRRIVEAAYNTSNHTTFIYLEDDMFLTWEQLQDWAADTALLEPKKFQRGFYRVEHAVLDGQLVLLDQREHISLDSYQRKLLLEMPDGTVKHFIQMPQPYNAMWLATRSQLETFMTSTQWRPSGKLHDDYSEWGVREMAACSMQFMDVPAGFFSASVVPYDLGARQLSPLAGALHLPNNYCARRPSRSSFCSVPVSKVFI